MPHSAIIQRRTHNLLLFQKLLSLRDGSSPFTLLLDSLEQDASSVVREFTVQAKASKTHIVFVSFETLRRPENVDVFIKARRMPLFSLRQEILSHISATISNTRVSSSRTIIIIDSLNPLASLSPAYLPTFLSSILSPVSSLIATYHSDIPLPSPSFKTPASSFSIYNPEPLTMLMFLATAILRVENFAQVIDRKRARDRSLLEPRYGLREGREGILVGLDGKGGKGKDTGEKGVVVEMEIRRKSGRAVKEVFVLSTSPSTSIGHSQDSSKISVGQRVIGSKFCLLDDHAAYARSAQLPNLDAEEAEADQLPKATFNMKLTEKQRLDREGVVLPYFDAQKDEGGGEGGRILYEMGREDDWDPEEDEI